MSKEVKRYGMCGFGSGIVEQVDGPYIYVDDYEALIEENRRLESAWKVDVLNRKDELLAKQEKENDRVKAEFAALLAERDSLRKALKKIEDADYKSSPTATDFGIAWDRGMLIGTMKDIARAALQGAQP